MGDAAEKRVDIRDDKGRFTPGNRASPGRTPIAKGGKPNAAGRARRAIEEDLPEIIAAIKEKALAGDMTAAKILLDRVSPALKSIEHVGLNTDNLPKMNIVIDAKPEDDTPSD